MCKIHTETKSNGIQVPNVRDHRRITNISQKRKMKVVYKVTVNSSHPLSKEACLYLFIFKYIFAVFIFLPLPKKIKPFKMCTTGYTKSLMLKKIIEL